MKSNLWIIGLAVLCGTMCAMPDAQAQVRVRKEQVLKQDTKPASKPAAKPVKKDVVNGHKCVDLGLSVRWAVSNVGGDDAHQAGSYLAWGETAEKKVYYWNSYAHWTDRNNDRNTQVEELSALPKCVAATEFDAAQKQWGKPWRLPTRDEVNELLNKCKLTWTTQQQVKGLLVTGPNGKSIFLPAAGYRKGSAPYYKNQFGCYLTADMSENALNADMFYFSHTEHKIKPELRAYGLSVRPVTK